MTVLCYLAAGAGSRFGENKLLYPVGGRPLWMHGLSVLTEVRRQRGCRLLTVSRYETILTAAAEAGAEAVCSPDSIHGMSHTVRCAVEHCGTLSASDRILFACADQPYLTAETVLRLLDTAPLLSDTLAGEAPLAACAAFGETEGNPVLFSACLAGELCALTGDRGGKAVLKRFPGRLLRVPCGSAEELSDIDLRSDLPDGNCPLP